MKSIRTLSQICLLAAALLSACGAMAQNFVAWPVTQVAVGTSHSLFTRADGTVYVMGDNTYGQLGLGSSVTSVNVPRQLTNGVSLIAAGSAHSLLVRGRTLLAMGDNSYGQLGDGTTNNHYVPELIYSTLSGSHISSVAAGGGHSLFTSINETTSGGGFYVMGENDSGQLGDHSYANHNTPEEIFTNIPGSPVVTAVAAGYGHSLFIKSDGTLWGMGANSYGQVGIPFNSTMTNKPVEVDTGNNGYGPVIGVSAGEFHSLYLTFTSYSALDNTLWGMGNNTLGALGPLNYDSPTYITEPEQIVSTVGFPISPVTGNVIAYAAGDSYSLFLLSDGSLWGMGINYAGQLGLKSSGDSDDPYFYSPVFITSDVVAVACGGAHSLFIKSDGSLWGMGYNADGELGTGDYTLRDTPFEIVAPPPQISIIAYGANVILAWTANSDGFVLQSTPDLAAPVWTTVSPGPVLVGDQFEALAPGSGTQKFYRLMLNQ
ncbi:MAG TPA: hypothetical protein VGM58_01350 [Verrucomicrobiae bacterium]|jgi:alpha-tubulin suppressor-like RCC1 family protein